MLSLLQFSLLYFFSYASFFRYALDDYITYYIQEGKIFGGYLPVALLPFC